MRVYISADLEGVAGVVHGEHTARDGREHERARRLMTAEVNAAVEGAFEAGAEAVVVNDAHGSMRNILPEELDSRAELVTGSPKPLGMLAGVDDGFDVAMFVGYHSRMGHPGVLNHTIAGSVVADVLFNGVPVGETGINATVCGHFGVPVVLVTGDDQVAQEARRFIAGVRTAVVKRALGRYAARCLHPDRARELIRQEAAAAVRGAVNVEPVRIRLPVEVTLRLQNTAMADAAELLPGTERIDPLTVRWQGGSALEAYRALRTMISLASAVRR